MTLFSTNGGEHDFFCPPFEECYLWAEPVTATLEFNVRGRPSRWRRPSAQGNATKKVAMDSHQDKADKANCAADAIAETMVKALEDLRPAIAAKYDLDDQLATLAIAQAAVGIAVDATSQATGMPEEKSNELEGRMQEAMYEAMCDLLEGKEGRVDDRSRDNAD
jgi:hypothetical protein